MTIMIITHSELFLKVCNVAQLQLLKGASGRIIYLYVYNEEVKKNLK